MRVILSIRRASCEQPDELVSVQKFFGERVLAAGPFGRWRQLWGLARSRHNTGKWLIIARTCRVTQAMRFAGLAVGRIRCGEWSGMLAEVCVGGRRVIAVWAGSRSIIPSAEWFGTIKFGSCKYNSKIKFGTNDNELCHKVCSILTAKDRSSGLRWGYSIGNITTSGFSQGYHLVKGKTEKVGSTLNHLGLSCNKKQKWMPLKKCEWKVTKIEEILLENARARMSLGGRCLVLVEFSRKAPPDVTPVSGGSDCSGEAIVKYFWLYFAAGILNGSSAMELKSKRKTLLRPRLNMDGKLINSWYTHYPRRHHQRSHAESHAQCQEVVQ